MRGGVFIWLAVAACGAAAPVDFRLPHPDAGSGPIRVRGYAFDDRTESIRLVDEGSLDHPRFGGIDRAMQAAGAVAGCNGGFFAPDAVPLGLMVADGVATGRLAGGVLTGGVLFRDDRCLLLLRVNEFRSRPRPRIAQLVQAGPLLVDAGRTVAGLDDSKPRCRTILVHDQVHTWAIGVTGEVTLRDLGAALAAAGQAGGVRAVRALNLDGGSSSCLWVRGAPGGPVLRNAWKPVRNYLAIVPK